MATPNYASTHNISLVYKHWFEKAKSFVSSTFQYSTPRVYTDPNKVGFNNQKMKAYKNFSLSWTYLHRQNIIFYASASNVFGSNIFDILVGLSIPLILAYIFTGPATILFDQIEIILGLMGSTILIVFFLAKKRTLTKTHGIILLGIYLFFFAYAFTV